MALCDLCTNLTVARLYPPSIYHHAKAVGVLIDSARGGCKLCNLMLRIIIAAEGYGDTLPHVFEPIDDSPDRPLLMEATDTMFDVDETEPYAPYGDIALRNSSIKLQILQESQRKYSTVESLDGFTHIGIWTCSKEMLSSLTLMVQEGDELGTRALTLPGRDIFISGRVLTNGNPSEAYFDVARHWLEDCKLRHSEGLVCGEQSTAPSLPDRVIEVGPEGEDPRLMNGTGLFGQYATLSHCWGGSSPMMTLAENLEQRMRNIPIGHLPKTFQDALQTCRALRIPYLWIDSLCIIQDSRSDWEVQSSKMHSIYRESTLTLAAMDAANSSEGLFIPKIPSVDVIALALTFGNGRGQAYVGPPTWSRYTHSPGPFVDRRSRFLFREIYNPMNRRYIKSGLLETRGWALQELKLSKRLLSFFKGEMMWTCNNDIWCQNGCSERSASEMHLNGALAAFEEVYRTIRKDLDDAHSQGKLQIEDSSSQDTIEDAYNENTIAGARIDSKRKQAETAHKQDRIVPSSHTSSNNEFNFYDTGDGCQDMKPSTDSRLVHRAFVERMNIETNAFQTMWYIIVEEYSLCDLTLSDDKLPALSGIASRYESIAKDIYVAGHWRMNIGNSLFWQVTAINSRAKPYRAPSWSWASMDASISWANMNTSSPNQTWNKIQVLDVEAVVQGKNPFGTVTSGKIVVKAKTMGACWNAEIVGWESSCKLPSSKYRHDTRFPLLVFDSEGQPTGHWRYDDALYGKMPETNLTADTIQGMRETRLVNTSPIPIAGPDTISRHDYSIESGPRVVMYIPEDILLVKGPPDRYDGTSVADSGFIYVLVLKKIDDVNESRHERVGIGRILGWDESVESEQTLTIV